MVSQGSDGLSDGWKKSGNLMIVPSDNRSIRWMKLWWLKHGTIEASDGWSIWLLLPWLLKPNQRKGGLGKPVFPTRPSLDGRARLDGRLWKIACLTPVFLRFCPSICDFGHVHECYWAVWQTGQQRFQRALNHKKTTKSLKPEFCPSLRPSNTRIFVQKAPVFCPYFYKNEPV